MLHRYTWRTLVREIVYILGALLFAVPVYLLVNLSLQTPAQTASAPLAPTTHADLGNYSQAWNSAGNGMGSALVTSIEVTACSVVALLVLGTCASYVVARSTSRLGSLGYVVFVLALLLPAQLGTIPLYAAMRTLDLVGQPLGLVVVYVGQLMPLTVFLISGFIRRLPTGYEEAAQVDGAQRWRILVRVVLPLLRPIVATVGIIDGLLIWNDFFLPLLWLGGSGNQTLPVALYSFVGSFSSEWNVIFAGIVIIVAPVLLFYIIVQKYLIRGFASGIRG